MNTKENRTRIHNIYPRYHLSCEVRAALPLECLGSTGDEADSPKQDILEQTEQAPQVAQGGPQYPILNMDVKNLGFPDSCSKENDRMW